MNAIDGYRETKICSDCSAKLLGCELNHDDFNEISSKIYLKNMYMYHYHKSSLVE
jgi:multimeric flavodoxin WrbA